MSKTICILIQVSDMDNDKAINVANTLAHECDSLMHTIGGESWRTAFPIVTNQDLIQTLNKPLMQIEDGLTTST